MNTHFDLSDSAFEKAFRDCTLDPRLFSHEAHLRLAWLHIDVHGIDRVIENICIQLKQFVGKIRA